MSEALYNDPAFARFYDAENGWAADTAACVALGAGLTSILDLGCGTGLLATALAECAPRVVGVDPAAAMLDIARGRAGGDRVTWVEGDARALDLGGERFDLVVMTGHAFQVFLTPADRLAVLRTIARHLGEGGRFIFDSRNPLREAWRAWTPEQTRSLFHHDDLGRVTSWNDVACDDATGIVTYRTFYQVGGAEPQVTDAAIAFPPREEIAALIAEAGLGVETWWGDWQGSPWTPDAPEIIPWGGLA
ncbi:class I SAM-dependent DNA methyltransferase [Zavarzinia sp. CC-PAN008]|uniref:class I SAM-dependent DNA methyltransferase n=1 Tax=Zavarzinia sp. CC-PAN008 TaxID=3243332 RepID=UPI003F742A27